MGDVTPRKSAPHPLLRSGSTGFTFCMAVRGRAVLAASCTQSRHPASLPHTFVTCRPLCLPPMDYIVSVDAPLPTLQLSKTYFPWHLLCPHLHAGDTEMDAGKPCPLDASLGGPDQVGIHCAWAGNLFKEISSLNLKDG